MAPRRDDHAAGLAFGLGHVNFQILKGKTLGEGRRLDTGLELRRELARVSDMAAGSWVGVGLLSKWEGKK